MSEYTETFDALEEGDRIELPEHYQTPMTVTGVMDDAGMVRVQDDRGNERDLIQSDYNEDLIGLIAGTRDKGDVTDINIL